MSDNKFHDHLDVCRQCREHPFDLCPVGAPLLEARAREILQEGVQNVPMEVITRETQPTFKKSELAAQGPPVMPPDHMLPGYEEKAPACTCGEDSSAGPALPHKTTCPKAE